MSPREPFRFGKAFWLSYSAFGLLLLVLQAATVQLGLQALVGDPGFEQQSRRTAQLVGESLYSTMLSGGGRAELQQMVTRLSAAPGSSVQLIRGEAVARDFGDLKSSQHAREQNALVAAALRTRSLQTQTDEQAMRIAHPVRIIKPCLACHRQARPGEIAAVILLTRSKAQGRPGFGLITALTLATSLLGLLLGALMLQRWRCRS